MSRWSEHHILSIFFLFLVFGDGIRSRFSWANLRALQRLVAKEEMVLDVHVRERQVNGIKTLQLETLGASAMQCFDKACIVRFQAAFSGRAIV